LLEENRVDVFGKGEVGAELAEVEGDAAHDHVALGDGLAVPSNLARFQVTLGFVQRELFQVDAFRGAVEQAAFVGEDLVGDPSGGRAANDEHQLVLRRAPAVPELLESGEEIRLFRV